MADNQIFGIQATGNTGIAGGGTIYGRIPGFGGGGGGGPAKTVDTGGVGSGMGAQLMKRAELNPQYEADLAATSVQDKGEAQMEAGNRRLAAMGIDPSSGRSRALNRNAGIALAAAKAGASNKARRAALMDNWTRMAQAARLVQSDQSRSDALNRFNASLDAEAAGTSGPVMLSSGRTSFERARDAGKTGNMTESQWKQSKKKVGGGRMGMPLARTGGGIFDRAIAGTGATKGIVDKRKKDIEKGVARVFTPGGRLNNRSVAEDVMSGTGSGVGAGVGAGPMGAGLMADLGF